MLTNCHDAFKEHPSGMAVMAAPLAASVNCFGVTCELGLMPKMHLALISAPSAIAWFSTSPVCRSAMQTASTNPGL